jgi:hypothetical protein
MPLAGAKFARVSICATYSSVTGARNFSTCQSCPANSTTVVLIYDQITSGVHLDALKTPNAVDYYFASITGADNINDCLCNAGYSGPHGGPCTACEQSKPTFGMTQCPNCVDDPTFSRNEIPQDFDWGSWDYISDPWVQMNCQAIAIHDPGFCLQSGCNICLTIMFVRDSCSKQLDSDRLAATSQMLF